MPRLDDIEVARQLRRAHRSVRLIFLTVEDADFARAALDAGGLGYVVKTRLASDLLPAIRAALADRCFISPTLRLDEAADSCGDRRRRFAEAVLVTQGNHDAASFLRRCPLQPPRTT